MPKLQSGSLSSHGQQLKGRFLTNDILKKKGIVLVDQCCMCRWDGEMVDHMILHCEIAYAMCSYVFCVFEVQWVILSSDLFYSMSVVLWMVKGLYK